MEKENIDLEKKSVKGILDEDVDNVVDQSEIDRIFRIHLDRVPTPEEISRFDGIKESEFKVIEEYIKSEEAENSLESEKVINEEKSNVDAMKIGGDLANKEMKIKGGQNLDMLKDMAAIPGMAGPAAGMPSVVPPMPQRPPMGGVSGPGPQQAGPNAKYIKDGKKFLVQFKD
ncbi:MAG: hypothetical protein KAJ30_00770 [Candidatus Heimdallarchaeota archaeon]|nr:hypothetical protein [Thermodesulfovibrionia bacterium]MCK5408769.1 hypothetical protein [Candidatus Heimdallarchaeota archaeon]